MQKKPEEHHSFGDYCRGANPGRPKVWPKWVNVGTTGIPNRHTLTGIGDAGREKPMSITKGTTPVYAHEAIPSENCHEGC